MSLIVPNHLRARRWRFAAHSMEECLVAVIKSNRIDETTFQPRLIESIRALLQKAIDVDSPREDPSDAIAAYRMAADALRTIGVDTDDEPDLSARLRGYLDFVGTLVEPRQLKPDELTTASHVRDFFANIFRAADSEAYEAAVMMEEPTESSR